MGPIKSPAGASKFGAKMWHIRHSSGQRPQKRGRISAAPFSPGRSQGQFNQLLPERPDVLLPLFLLFFFLSSVLADAPFEQHPLDADLLQEAPFESAEAEAPLEQQPAALSLLHELDLPSVEAEAPADLLQHPADFDLSHEAFSLFEQEDLLASLAHVCSVLAFLSAGASVDWADTVKAKMANAPRKRNFFMMLLSFEGQTAGKGAVGVDKIRTPAFCRIVHERISLFLPSRKSQERDTKCGISWRGGRVVMQQPAKL